MRRIVALFAAVAVLLIAAALPVSAAVQRDRWDTDYSLAPDQFCGGDISVDVHDYGSNVYFRVSADGWDWAKEWSGTRDYRNPATSRTATLRWTWMTTQTVESRDQTTMSLLITSRGTTRVLAANGAVVASQGGQITYRRVLVASGGGWTQPSPDEPVSWNGPHELDLGSAFCDAMTALL